MVYTTCCTFRKEKIRTFSFNERASYEKITHQKLCNSDYYEILHFCPGCYVFSCQVWNLSIFVTEEASSLFTTETIPQCTSENGDCLLKLKAQTVAIRSLLFLVLHYLCNCIWQPPEYYFNLLPIETVPSHFMSKLKFINSFMFPVSVAGPHLFRTYYSCSYLSTTDHVWEKSLQKKFLPSFLPLSPHMME